MRSEAKKKADKKYRMKKLSDGTKKQINATLDIDDYKTIDDYSKEIGISKAQLIVKAIKYCADNEIDFNNETIAIMIDHKDARLIANEAMENGYTIEQYMVRCCLHCIDHNIMV